MNFATTEFFIFFLLVFVIYWRFDRRHQNIFLCIASYLFYACWDWRFLSLIFVSTLNDYVCGARIHGSRSTRVRKTWLVLSLVINLGILGVFKYFGFFVDSLVDLAAIAGWHLSKPVLTIVLPVGISFYTFQTMSYSIDIYREKLVPTRSFVDFAAFVAFFPQLVAGPIVRAREFIFQLETERRLEWQLVQSGLTRFAYGYFMKTFVADSLGVFLVDPVFCEPAVYSTSTLWLAIVGYSAQIYADFSGYSNMAIGTSKLLGFRIPENFATPYVAVNISDFWRRWHMTMSRFFRDYVYIGLGGNRHGMLRTMRNLAVTTLVSGLWHGAGWTFVIWGGLHGVYLATHQLWRHLSTKNLGWAKRRSIINVGLAWVLTQFGVVIAWVMFRATSFSDAVQYLRGMLSSGGAESISLTPAIVIAVAAVVGDHVIGLRYEKRNLGVQSMPAKLQAAALVAMIIILFNLRPPAVDPFIYFQF